MKKIVCLLSAAVMLLSLASCDISGIGNPADNIQNDEIVKADTVTKKAEETKPAIVEITIPKSLIGNMTEEEIKENTESQGFISYKMNEDGSVTYELTEAQRTKLIEDFASETEEGLKGYVDGEQAISSFRKIEHDNQFKTIKVYVNKYSFTDYDTRVSSDLYLMGYYFQIFSGVKEEDVDVTIKYIDQNNDDELFTWSQKDFAENQ